MSAEASVGEIAGRLTFIEQCFLSEGRIRMAYPFEVQARDRLIARGLVTKRWFSYRWTPLGLAVRNHLNRPDAEKEMGK